MVSEPTVISTFAGCGGSSLGYQLAGFKELLAVEWDDNAVETFKLNFPDVPVYHGDIHKLTVERCCELAGIKSGELDVLDGSPPCQGFSTAGKRRLDDPRNNLAFEFIRLLTGLQPKVFVMENVTGLIKGVMKQTYLAIVKAMRVAGYRVKGQVMNAMYYGVPQSRERVIVIGVRNDLEIESSHPKPYTQGKSLRCILDLRDGALLRREWGPRLLDGIKNKQFNNRWRSLDLPCVTLEKTRPPILLINGVQRELTLQECGRIASFPDSFRWSSHAYGQIGNSVPPNLMRAIAEHVRDNLL